MNQAKCPLKIERASINESERNTRSVTAGKLIENGKTELPQATFIRDAKRIQHL